MQSQRRPSLRPHCTGTTHTYTEGCNPHCRALPFIISHELVLPFIIDSAELSKAALPKAAVLLQVFEAPKGDDDVVYWYLIQ